MSVSREPRSSEPPRSKLAMALRALAYALLVAFVIGLVIGTLIRREIEKPVRYIGGLDLLGVIGAEHPGHIAHAQPPILMPRHHEEQI